MDTPPRLGPYRLDAVIGRGGVGHVWRAQHALSQQPVAIKVLTHETFSRPEARAQIESEVRAAARLDHPALVQVHDAGRVPFGCADLAPGSPWIAMELLEGLPLNARCGALTWRGVRHVLLHLLDGLAHAHAMGVLHRDVKPSNILVSPGLGRVTLTDFGLARALEAMDRGRVSIAGTPAYMSPEQIEARWRDFTPATDLYAVGCLTHVLTTGRPPFPGRGTAVFAAHLSEAPPTLAWSEAPAGLDGWARRLLAKRGADRFQRAADAAEALIALGEPAAGPLIRPGAAASSAHDPQRLAESLELITARQDPSPPTAPWSAPADAPERLVPMTWRRPERPRGATRPRACGLGVLRLRRLPLLGRMGERNTLWTALREVAATGQPRAVVLAGHAGVGKTHLAEWLAVRAHEIGVAEVLRARFAAVPGPAHGLGAMLARWTRCVGLPRPAIRARLGHTLPGLSADDRQALAALMAPDEAADASGEVVFSHPRERHAVLGRLLARVARVRPVIVLLDDVQHADGAVEWIADLLASAAPVLCVLTVQLEALAEAPANQAALAALSAAGARSITLGPLGDRTSRRLLGEQLGLAPEAAARVAQRVRGNPLFAVQLVRDWAQRRAFEATGAGYVLRPEVSGAGLPASLHAVWSARVERLVQAHPTHAPALELAATLGVEVDGAEWRAVCAAAGVADPAPARDALLAAGLADEARRGAADGWSFAHGMLRESFIAEARAAGRLPGLHRLCAQVLAGRAGPARDERVALHLLAGEAWREAVPRLLRAAEAQYTLGGYGRTARLLDAAERGLARLGDAEAAARGWQLRGQVLRGRLARACGQMDVARALIADAVARADGLQPGATLARLEATQLAFDAGEPARAAAHLQIALDAARAGTDRAIEARCHDWQAIIALRRGDLDGAEASSLRAATHFDLAGDDAGRARCDLLQARIAEQRGHWGRAMVLNQAAQRRYGRLGVRSGLAECANHLGELARQAGELDTAERAYKEALRIWTTIGSGYVAFARANLGLVQYARGDLAAARESLIGALAGFEASGRLAPATEVNACLLACAAQRGDWPAFDQRLTATAALAHTGEFAHGDVARLTRTAGAHALEAGERGRAAQAWELARAQWARLGNTQAVAQLDARLARLRGAEGG